MSAFQSAVRYVCGEFQFELPDGTKLKLKPQECWRLVEQARNLLIENSSLFEPNVLREVSREGRRFQVLVSKNNDFWNSYHAGRWERHTFHVFDRFLTEGSTYLDIGAWIGPTLFYAGQIAKASFGFEPDPVAFAELDVNLRANQNEAWSSKVAILNKAIANETGKGNMGNQTRAGNSESSFLFAKEATAWQVETLSLGEFLKVRKIDGHLFIKVDIEGGEYSLIPALCPIFRAHDVDLYLSLHPRVLKSHLVSTLPQARTRIRRRFEFFSFHRRLLNNLPFKYIYNREGARLDPLLLKYTALVSGRFPTEIVATNKMWDLRKSNG